MGVLNFYFLIAAILVCACGRYWGAKIALLANIIFLVLSFLTTTFLAYEVVYGAVTEVTLWSWFNTFSINSSVSIYYDFLSTLMIWLVLTISLLVHVFSYSYMEHDPMKVRFFFFLSLFTFFMCFLVISSSFLQFFFAWEGVGLTSYLLINFWYTRIEANRAALKALIINRFGDFGLYTGLLLIIVLLNSSSIALSNASQLIYLFMPTFEFHFEDLICFFLFIGVVGKSAQLGLHTWLPDAMEGPTPVSALLHAATMVTAGVFLLLRLAEFFMISNFTVWICFWGALSAFFASTVGVFQYDIKKIIAYSTCSQLGYMVAACGMLNFSGAFFHLFNHAFFQGTSFPRCGFGYTRTIRWPRFA
jgi:NADH:ubiquinone oxidoreductase subunit 5 (subunit L)/multisubunit Na+/H+ antiporter MnhA subunit